MKTRITHSLFLLTFAIAGLLLLSAQSFAQQKPNDKTKDQKTITIHVTKVDGDKTTVIDTTVVTEGDFDADAYLEQKGVSNDNPEKGSNVEKHIIIRHPGNNEYGQNESGDDSPDTIIINTDREYAFNDQFDFDAPPAPRHPDKHFRYFQYDNPRRNSQMEGPQMEDMLEGLARSFGLDDVMPFGDMKQVVVKMKRNGKKVIITFEDKDKTQSKQDKRHEERVIILNDNNTGMAPRHEERGIIQGDPGEGAVNEKDIEKTAPVKQQKKVIIIQEEKTK